MPRPTSAETALSCPLHPGFLVPVSRHRRQPCAVDQQVNPRTDQPGPLHDHRVLFSLVEGAVALQKIEAPQRLPVNAEQFASDREAAALDHRGEVAEIEQVEVAASRAGADKLAGCKKVV